MQVQGIITGIGDRENNINVITPQVDAAVRHHILGHYEIIDGLNIVTENGVPVLKKGSCVLCGYQGTLTQDIQLDPTVDKYIYGRFRIYFSENINDSFSVLVVNYNASGSTVDPTVINNEFNDYLLRLYTYNDSLGEYVISSHLDTALDFQYLKKVYSADMAEVLQNGGTIASNVTATTQSINDNSTKVATTEYVHNQIEEEIGREIKQVYQFFSGGRDGMDWDSTATMKLEYRAKFVLIKEPLQFTVRSTPLLDNQPALEQPKYIGGTRLTIFSSLSPYTSDYIPPKFRPKKNICIGHIYFAIYDYQGYPQIDDDCDLIFATDGAVYLDYTFVAYDPSRLVGIKKIDTYEIGFETN